MRMGSKASTIKEKCYDVTDPTLNFVDGEDDLDFLCEGFSSRRAQMSCGHAVTPTSLTNWCRKLLDEGESKFFCGQYDCAAQWSYAEVCKMALLTPQEKTYFELKMYFNTFETRLCPRCKSSVVRKRDSNLRVVCRVCTAQTKHLYHFCWQCMRDWKGPHPRPDSCGNEGCGNFSLRTLASCPDIVFKCVKGVTGCPSIRACPTCGCLLEHQTTQCKCIFCPRCKVEFCFVCLKLSDDCLETSSAFELCAGGVALRQTAMPVWGY